MRIEERIERLERESRSLRRVVLTLSGSAAAALLVALVAGSIPATVAVLVATIAALIVLEHRQSSVPDVIRAQKIEVVGADGGPRVVLGETVDGVGAVATYDAGGQFMTALADKQLKDTAGSKSRRGRGDGRPTPAPIAAPLRTLQR